MIRSSSWLISAWKPKLSEAIFAREYRKGEWKREKVRDEASDSSTSEEERRQGSVRVYVLACACHSRTFHLHRPKWTGARVLALSGRECSAAFHALLQHLPHSEHTTSLVRAVASYAASVQDQSVPLSAPSTPPPSPSPPQFRRAAPRSLPAVSRWPPAFVATPQARFVC